MEDWRYADVGCGCGCGRGGHGGRGCALTVLSSSLVLYRAVLDIARIFECHYKL